VVRKEMGYELVISQKKTTKDEMETHLRHRLGLIDQQYLQLLIDLRTEIRAVNELDSTGKRVWLNMSEKSMGSRMYVQRKCKRGRTLRTPRQ